MKLLRFVPLAALITSQAAAFTPTESSRDMVIELKMGSYKPEIDSEFGALNGNTPPYEAIFGDGSATLTVLGIHRHLFNEVGTATLGMTFGIWSVSGSGLDAAGEPTSESTELSLIPLGMEIGYAFDLYEDFIPIVPTFRLGLDYYVWKILDGSDDTASFESGKTASGGTWGYHYSIGARLLLDFLAPQMAADFDRDAGVNNSYLTFEYQSSTVDDFGSADSFRLGNDTFLFGLALDL